MARVVKTLGDTVAAAAAKAAPLQASSLLERMHHIYLAFNLKDDAERMAKEIRILGPKIREAMTPVSHEFRIPADALDAFVERVTGGNLDQAFARVAIEFIPRRGQIENQLHDLGSKAPMTFLIGRQLLDQHGRVLAAVGSIEGDLDGNVVNQMAQNVSISQLFLATVLDGAITKFKVSESLLVAHLFQSPAFVAGQEKILLAALQAYLQAHWLVAIHLFVPQIEGAIRNLIELSGGAVLKTARRGGFHLKTLDELLRMEELVRTVGEDVTLYFRVLLTDQRGWNIRNDVSHGLSPYENFSKGVADRLLHVLLILAELRIEPAADEDGHPA